MKPKFQLCIVIPAFNEGGKLDAPAYISFLSKHPECFLVLANDASTDDTLDILTEIQKSQPENVHILSGEKNTGKAETVRLGMLWAKDKELATKYAFLDADLATSLEECLQVADTVQNQVVFSFGSRILTVDSHIKRKAYRHYIGRVVATAISKTLRLPIYDTQCGCKVFDEKICSKLFEAPFISRWLFDVELFFRTLQLVGRENIENQIHEHPLKQWIDKGESKVKFSYFFKLWVDLFKIRAKYKGV